jgi:hypothetical protein
VELVPAPEPDPVPEDCVVELPVFDDAPVPAPVVAEDDEPPVVPCAAVELDEVWFDPVEPVVALAWLPAADVDDEVVVDAAWPDDVVSEPAAVPGAPVPLVEVDDDVDVELPVAALADSPAPEPPTGAVHHLVIKVAVVFPEVCDALEVTGWVTVVGLELVAVFEELWVLAVPPLMVG